ncbi:YesL family protein [Eubacterium ruminantium]|uniref:YesL family protein n=1 Tax=Eubacterium ruminantium TaxID=42322 RepID=UPI001569B31E|nr:YesL family protein [Eubacterium ruminantium]
MAKTEIKKNSKKLSNSVSTKSKNVEDSKAVSDVKKSQVTGQTENPEPVNLTAGQKFFIAMDKFGDFFILNILFFICCIPIVTIGASVTALYTVLIKMVKNQEGVARRDFFKAFKRNFKPATFVWLVIMVVGAAIYLQYAYVVSFKNQTASFLLIILAFEMMIVSMVVPLVFPLVARYTNTTFNYFKNAFIISITNVKEWLVILLHILLPLLIYYVNPRMLLYTCILWAIILYSIFTYSKSIVMWKIFDRLENPDNDSK